MASYHVNRETGDVGPCHADKGRCPFGSLDEHFTTQKAARANYEKGQALFREEDHELQMLKFNKANPVRGYATEIDNISYAELVRALGKPMVLTAENSDGKVQAEWIVKTPYGTISIYDWKSEEPASEVTTWHIGGDKTTAEQAANWLNSFVKSKKMYPWKRTPRKFEDWATVNDRAVWARRARLVNTGDQLGSPVRRGVSEADLNKVRNGPKPERWNEMGSSEKDLWEERMAESSVKTNAVLKWQTDLAEKATDDNWVKSLDDANLDRLATVVSGRPAATFRETFDRTGEIERWSGASDEQFETQKNVASRVRDEIARRIVTSMGEKS